MGKWPTGIAKIYNEAVRAALVPILVDNGFGLRPPPGLDGQWNQYAYETELFRAKGTDVDIVQISVWAHKTLERDEIIGGRILH